MPQTMNFGSPNLTKQKKKNSLEKQQNVTTFFTRHFIFNCSSSWSYILLYYFLYLQYFNNKLLLISNWDHHLKLCNKKDKKSAPIKLLKKINVQDINE